MINLVFTFTVPGISIAGHLGGLVIGALVALVLAYAPRRGGRWSRSRGGAVVVLALLGLALVRTAAIVGG